MPGNLQYPKIRRRRCFFIEKCKPENMQEPVVLQEFEPHKDLDATKIRESRKI